MGLQWLLALPLAAVPRTVAPALASQEISAQVLWEKTKDQDGQHNTWYKKAVSYWDQQEASYDGVLGGFGFVSDIDIRDSQQLLLKVLPPARRPVARH